MPPTDLRVRRRSTGTLGYVFLFRFHVRTAVISQPFHLQAEFRFGGHFKCLSPFDRLPSFRGCYQDIKITGNDFHNLFIVGIKLVFPGQHYSQSLSGTIRKNNRAAGDLSVKINTRFFDDCYVFFSRGALPEYQWMNVPEVFLYSDIDKALCNCF